ncbi:hypothetical protein [Oryza sativa Japonica Group]|uniref:Uncharacterized protein n=1 Tax=Oryza sativa subsp. japonica TaxID=39947 RepID=Q8RYP7_ORYSJ|nr:hypothetical protein [Oryza sativa Japonica Group]BAC10896.1 hypothetical protein [Oryza sativa Japonica Group]
MRTSTLPPCSHAVGAGIERTLAHFLSQSYPSRIERSDEFWYRPPGACQSSVHANVGGGGGMHAQAVHKGAQVTEDGDHLVLLMPV